MPAISVPCRSICDESARIAACGRVLTVIDDIDAREHLAAKIGMRRVDPGVEERDRDPATVEAGQLGVRSTAARRSELVGCEHLLGDRRGEGGTHGEHTCDFGHLAEQ